MMLIIPLMTLWDSRRSVLVTTRTIDHILYNRDILLVQVVLEEFHLASKIARLRVALTFLPSPHPSLKNENPRLWISFFACSCRLRSRRILLLLYYTQLLHPKGKYADWFVRSSVNKGTIHDQETIWRAHSSTQGYWKKTLTSLQQMKASEHSAREFAYNVAINACARGNRVIEALQTMENMRESNMCPSLATHNNLISACSRTKQWQTAFEIIEVMKSDDKVRPDTVTNNAAMSAWGNSGQWTNSLELFDSMIGLGLNADVVTISAAISACGRGGQWENALELFESMPERGIESADVITFNAIIDACGKGGQWEKALQILESMPGHGLKPDVLT